jgi:hypothetical protein
MDEAAHSKLSWVSSSYCTDTTCVQVASEGDFVFLRDGKWPDRAVLRFTRAEWDAFLSGAKSGQFDSL